MSLIPKKLDPLERDIFTGEGILVYATSVGLAIASVVPNGLSWTHSGLYLAIVAGAHTLSRSLLKASAVQSDLGLPQATPFDPVDPSVIAESVATFFKDTGAAKADVPSPVEPAAPQA